MIVQVILSRERVTAFLARIILRLLVTNDFVDATLPVTDLMVTRMRYGTVNTCEQKVQRNDDFRFKTPNRLLVPPFPSLRKKKKKTLFFFYFSLESIR